MSENIVTVSSSSMDPDPEPDLSVCGECWNPYDAKEHQPKVLNCRIHPMRTICLKCLQSGKCSSIICETCSDSCVSWSVDELPVNIYALQLAQLQSKKKTETETETSVDYPAREENASGSNGEDEEPTAENSFDFLRCPFVFTFFMEEVNLGQVQVMSSPVLIQNKFVQSLGEFSFRSPKEFYVDSPKLTTEAFYELDCFHPDFQPIESKVMVYADPSKLATIGMEQLLNLDAAIEPAFDPDGKLIRWKFVFALKDSNQLKRSGETVWGTVTSGHAVLEWLATNMKQQGIGFTLETRNPTKV